MKKLLAVLPIVALTGCVGSTDTLMGFVEEADEKHMETVVERVKLYCAATTEVRRAANQKRLDIGGKGPILEAHCDRF